MSLDFFWSSSRSLHHETKRCCVHYTVGRGAGSLVGSLCKAPRPLVPEPARMSTQAAQIAALQADVASLRASLDSLQSQQSTFLDSSSANTWWLLSNGVLVFFMQCGFGMLEAGTVTARATQNVLLKNLLDTCMGALMWWAVGYGIAYDGTNGFIGMPSSKSLFFTTGLMNQDEVAFNLTTSEVGDAYGRDWALWWFQFSFAAVSATIVSGAVAERTQLAAYISYATAMIAFIYPVVARWVWSDCGWLSQSNPNAFLGGAMDFAGSGAVHLTGGIAVTLASCAPHLLLTCPSPAPRLPPPVPLACHRARGD